MTKNDYKKNSRTSHHVNQIILLSIFLNFEQKNYIWLQINFEFFLKLGMKLGIHRGLNVLKPFFHKVQKTAKKGKKWPKRGKKGDFSYFRKKEAL